VRVGEVAPAGVKELSTDAFFSDEDGGWIAKAALKVKPAMIFGGKGAVRVTCKGEYRDGGDGEEEAESGESHRLEDAVTVGMECE